MTARAHTHTQQYFSALHAQMMHSQLTDFLSTHLAVEESLSTMFAVSLDTKVACFSLCSTCVCVCVRVCVCVCVMCVCVCVCELVCSMCVSFYHHQPPVIFLFQSYHRCVLPSS